MTVIGQNGFKTKLVVSRVSAVSLPSYLFVLSTIGFAQSDALRVDENDRVHAKT